MYSYSILAKWELLWYPTLLPYSRKNPLAIQKSYQLSLFQPSTVFFDESVVGLPEEVMIITRIFLFLFLGYR